MSIRTQFYHCLKSARIRSFHDLYFLVFGLNTRDTPDRISSNKCLASNKRHPLTSAATLGIRIAISASL